MFHACQRIYTRHAGVMCLTNNLLAPRKPNFKDLRMLRDQSGIGFDIASRYIAPFCPCRYLMGLKVTFGI